MEDWLEAVRVPGSKAGYVPNPGQDSKSRPRTYLILTRCAPVMLTTFVWGRDKIDTIHIGPLKIW
jgi:hypothetical protein